SFHRYIDNIDWLSLFRDFRDLDEAMHVFLFTLRGIFDSFFPFVTVRVKSSDKPWVRPSLKVLINARDRAFALCQIGKYRRLRAEVIRHVT
ncbi:MAG: hypothetical protein AAGK05_16565, partial [Pseudomonadota bacterium]